MPQAAGFVIGALGLGGAVAGTSAFAIGVAAGASAGFVTTLAIRLATTVALSALSRALAPKPKLSTQGSGVRTDATLTGGTNPESFILGRFATAGVLVAPPMTQGKSGDTPNAYLTYVVEVGGIPGAEIDGVLINGEDVPILPTGAHADYGRRLGGRYEGHAWVRWHDGTQTTADSMLLSKFGGASARAWSASMIGRGIPYMVVTFKFKREVYTSFPNVKAVLRGARLYDPREDSTAGGVGSQRWSDPSTWQWSENPGVMIYNILRGITLPSGDMWGGGIDAADLPYVTWSDAMDACDSPVSIIGGNEPQHTAGLEVMVSDEPFTIIGHLLDACNGLIAERGGVWSIRIGPPGLPVMAISDDDLPTDSADRYRPFPEIRDVYNAIEGTWTDPDSAWQSREADPIYNGTWEAEDGGRRLTASVDLGPVTRGTQAQRIMAAKIADHRRMRVHSITMPQDASGLDILDTITWTSETNDYAGKLFEVRSVTLGLRTGRVGLTIRETDASDWLPPVVARPSTPDASPVIPPIQEVPGWAAVPVAVTDSASTRRVPAVRLSWWPEEMEDVRGLRIAMRFQGEPGDGSEISLVDVRAGSWDWPDVIPGQAYEFRARAAVDRPTEWSAWVQATAPEVELPLVSGDRANLVPDSQLVDEGAWLGDGALQFGPYEWSRGRILFAPDPARAQEALSLFFPIIPGAAYFAQFVMEAAVSGGTVEGRAYLMFYNEAGAQVGTEPASLIAALSDIDGDPAGKVLNVPPGATQARLRFFVPATNQRNVYFYAPLVRRAYDAGMVVLEESITTPMLVSDEVAGMFARIGLLEIDGQLVAFKGSPDAATPGIFLGNISATDERDFALAASTTRPSGKVQELKITGEEFVIRNANFYKIAPGATTSYVVTDSVAKVPLPSGIAAIRIDQALGGGGGGATRYAKERHYAGSNGGATTVRLFDGAVLKHTITAPGGAAGYWGDRVGQNSAFGSSAGQGAPATGFAAGGSGSMSGAGTSGGIKGGAKRGATASRDWISLDGWADPQIEITVGSGGAGGPPSGKGPPYDRQGGPGSPGRVTYTISTAEEVASDVVPLMPSASGTFVKAANTPGTFPDLGPGMWCLFCASSFGLGDVNLGNATQSMNTMDSATIVASATPTYTGGGGSVTIFYQFYAMGDRG